MNRSFRRLIGQFRSKRILVVGDVMLDEYIFGRHPRDRAEAPRTPVILVGKKTYALGGAANVANNIVSLGGRAALMGIIGNDTNGDIVVRLLKKSGVGNMLIRVADRPTTTKTRVFENHRQLTRIDQELAHPLKKKTAAAVAATLRVLRRKKIDFVIVSDYAKGMLSRELVQSLAAQFGKDKIVGDVKPRHAALMRGVCAIAPNLKEAAEMSGIRIKTQTDAMRAGRMLMRRLNTSVIVTMGHRGILVVERGNGGLYKIAPKKIRAVDVTGAGDTVTAALALALSCGVGLAEAAEFANRTASIAVTKLGTATVRKNEILNA